MRLLRKGMPALWLAVAIVFPFDLAGREIAGIGCPCPNSTEDTVPTSSHANCAQLQGIPNSWRREDKPAVTEGPGRPDPINLRISIHALPAKPYLDGEAFLLSQRWQFSLRAAFPPRAPTSARSSC